MDAKFHKISSYTWRFQNFTCVFTILGKIWHSFSRTAIRNFLWCYYRRLITSLCLNPFSTKFLVLFSRLVNRPLYPRMILMIWKSVEWCVYCKSRWKQLQKSDSLNKRWIEKRERRRPEKSKLYLDK